MERYTDPTPSPRADAAAGLRDIAPALVAVVPIALLFGALAATAGLSVAETGLMSLLVFAGGAQFAALGLWHEPIPVLAIVASTVLVNARHLLMGASLARKLANFSWVQRLAAAYPLTDEAWALAERRALTRPLTPAYWFALAPTLVPVWVGASVLGASLGALLGDPARLGADFAFAALFIGLIAGLWRGRTTGLTVAVSGAAAAVTYRVAGPPWHVLAGALAGIAAAYFTAGPGEEAPSPSTH